MQRSFLYPSCCGLGCFVAPVASSVLHRHSDATCQPASWSVAALTMPGSIRGITLPDCTPSPSSQPDSAPAWRTPCVSGSPQHIPLLTPQHVGRSHGSQLGGLLGPCSARELASVFVCARRDGPGKGQLERLHIAQQPLPPAQMASAGLLEEWAPADVLSPVFWRMQICSH